MSVAALIFDVDGTIADTEEAHRRAFNEAFARHGLDWNWTKPRYAELLLTSGGKERIAAYVEGLRLDPAQRDALVRRIPEIHRTKTGNFAAMVGGGSVPLREGVARLFDEAEHAGVRLAIASTTTFANIAALIDGNLGAGALGRFAAIGAGDQVERKKPASDVYELVLARLGLPAAACVAIEDSANGLAAAKSAGLFTVVTPGYWTQGEDFSAADLVLPTLGSAARPLPPRLARLVGGDTLGITQLNAHLAGARRTALAEGS